MSTIYKLLKEDNLEYQYWVTFIFYFLFANNYYKIIENNFEGNINKFDNLYLKIIRYILYIALIAVYLLEIFV